MNTQDTMIPTAAGPLPVFAEPLHDDPPTVNLRFGNGPLAATVHGLDAAGLRTLAAFLADVAGRLET